ncbi:unnamed protein product [Heligmosomoides polygyrus]|uniref:Uncharacterized protein n=1 Tax=Heligmosomoides polygyrus TaxID=6339 RepID=A0A183F7D5_HELPZ|nr:unnamed protein product [Heligmosomoides polygyrus]
MVHLELAFVSTVHEETETTYPLKSIDRFARQNRYGLPPEFPLTSSCSGIVHHLSGHNLYALPLPICKQTRQGHGALLRKRNGSHVSRLNDLHFHYALGLHFQATRLQGMIVQLAPLPAQVSHPLRNVAPIKGTLDMQHKLKTTPIRYIS